MIMPAGHHAIIGNEGVAPAWSPPERDSPRPDTRDVYQSIAPLETGARNHAYRSPDTGVLIDDTPESNGPAGIGSTPYIRPPGVPRALKSPIAYLVRLVRPYDGKDNFSTGDHTMMDIGASTPEGEMRPPREGTTIGNSWRAKPAPWDSATFVAAEA